MKKLKVFNPDFWEKTWDRVDSFSSISFKKETEKRWLDFWNNISNRYFLRNKKEEKNLSKIVNFLEKEKLFSKESEILDIGCGPGTYALLFARKVKKVMAIDPAEKMLFEMMKEAKKRKIKNIVPVKCRWEDFTSDKKFDLVFASLTPAIRNSSSLLKMNNLSCKYVCIINYYSTNEMKFRDKLWKEIIKKPFYSITFHQINLIFNYLYTTGITPNVHFFEFEYPMEEYTENLARQYENYFKIFVKVDKTTKDKIYNYFKNYSKNGMIKEIMKRKIAVIWWLKK